ncbi:MAG: protein arginine kinase [Bacilli bacterium]
MDFETFRLEEAAKWMAEQGPNAEIILSTRVRLARNVMNYPFPLKGSLEVKEQFLNEMETLLPSLSEVIGEPLTLVKMRDLTAVERRTLVEKHLISPSLAEKEESGAYVVSKSEKISFLLNEEDHIRIQCLFTGLRLEEAYDVANAVDDLLESNFAYAYHPTVGYLTACPTNLGTGMRASVMLHLPALVLTNQLQSIMPAIQKLGFVIRGFYGEGTEALGHIFQVSNQTTLGNDEQTTIQSLHHVIKQLIATEESSRKLLTEQSRIQLEDHIYRALGVLKSSRILPSKEAFQCLSYVKLGVQLGMIAQIEQLRLNELMIFMQPALLQKYANESLSMLERDVRRATLMRSALKHVGE